MQVLPVYPCKEWMPFQRFEVPTTSGRTCSQTLLWIFFKQVDYQILRIRVEVFWELILHVYYLLKSLPFLAGLEWKITTDHLVDYDPKGP